MTAQPGTVFLGWVHGGTVRAEFMASVLRLLGSPASALIGQAGDLNAGALVARGRNLLAARFLATSLPWLWMVDTDMVFTPVLLPALLEAADPDKRPVMSAVYLICPGTAWIPALYDATETDGHPDFEPRFTRPGDGVIEVGGCGAGCLLIHRTALEAIRNRFGADCWFDELRGPVPHGEDLSFCVRAAQAGIPVHAHGGARAGHVKPHMFGQPT